MLLTVGAPEAFAQGVTGSAITGVVRGPNGTPVAGAEVQLVNPDTGDFFTATTGSNGRYFIDNVSSGGPYLLTISAQGFEPTGLGDINLSLGQRLTLDLNLQAGGVEEIVIQERIDVLQDSGRTGPSTTLNSQSINTLPLQGRNFTDLISTSPQASGNSIGGQNNRYNNIQIDGGANNDLFGLANNGTPGGQAGAKPISIEALKEFVIQVAPFDVRQGSFTGGLINAVTKSGTNEFHGSLFGYYQNKSLAGFRDDPSFLDYNIWQFGGSVGGPIVKDKVHFFVSADIQERESAFSNQFQIGGVDSAADIMRAGFDVATVQRFRDILINQYGVPDPGDALAPTIENPDRNIFAKVSTSVIPNSRMELSYNLVDATQDNLNRAPTSTAIPGRLRDGYQLSNAGYGQANTTHTARVKLTSFWGGGRFSNEFLAGFSIIRDEREIANRLPLILVKVGQIGSSDSWLAAGGERFSHENLLDQDVFSFQDNLTFAVGDHRLTVGTSNEILGIRNVFFQAAYGVWAFDDLNDNGSGLDELEAGTAAAFQRRFGVANSGQDAGTAAFDVFQLGFYVQDEWSLLPNLTLTPGVRIDVPFLSDAVTNPVLVNNAAFPIDTGEVPSGNLLWSPRLGFNWDVDGSADTIVRGGLGIFTGRPPYVWVSNAYSINGLSQVELTCTGMVPTFTVNPDGQPSDCVGGSGTPAPPTNQGEIDYFDPDTKYPQNFRVALGADRRLPWDMLAAVDLLYTRDINGWYVTDENLMALGESAEGRQLYGTFGATGFSASPTRIDPANLRQAVKVRNQNGGRVYTATVQLQKEFERMFNVALGYTYSNAKDLMSLTSSQALSNFQFAPLDGTIQDRNARPSAFDRPHKITLTGTANLPYGFGIGLSYVGQSGTPYTWTVNGDVNADGINGNDVAFIPAAAGDISLMDPSQFDGLNAFIESQDCLRGARGRFVKRGECRNPWQNFVNLRLAWQSPPVLGQRIEVQWDIFNLMNLINSDWGLFDQAAQFENHGAAFLRAVGYDTAANRPIYTFTAPAAVETTIYTPTLSRWRMQLGARYTF